MNNSIEPKELMDEFMNQLLLLRHPDIPGNTAKIAKLKRGLGQQPLQNTEAMSVIYTCVREGTPDYLREVYEIIAPLFALYPTENGTGNLGRHFRELCGEEQQFLTSDQDKLPANVERRFMRLLASEPNELADTLRPAILLLKSKDVLVNWHRLLEDLVDWQFPDQRAKVRSKWSRSFWKLKTTKADAGDNLTNEQDDDSTLDDE